ncbi:hypothetical protein D9X30_5031 [Cupriavidus sp. U2]|jgi:archaellum component FlaC|uniref:hypothetical protein n=1 Tax=Cupriavidus sp. U2 TaxID=2920269 RepID=UPI00129E22DA|nr:hypothetical protein [Cupriavidus sp. U2]KAI3589448.1 hypothetical protein D9X30_5031 [Cupriavidus sp. U2]
MSITMSADQLSSLPDAADPTRARQHRHPPRHDWRMAATIFTAVFVALGGIFAILDYSGRQSDKTTDNIYYRFDMVDERLGVMDRQSQATDKRFDGIDRRIDRLEVKVDEGFAKVDRRLDKMDERFNNLEVGLGRKFDQIDRKFTQIDQRFDQIDGKIGQIADVLHLLVEQKATSGATEPGQKLGSRPR